MTTYRPKLVENAFVDFISERISPFHSPLSPKVQLVNRQWLTDDLIALQLRPNKNWLQRLRKVTQGTMAWQPGQNLTLGVTLGGIRHNRSYSLVGTPMISALLPATYSDQQTVGKSQDQKQQHKSLNTLDTLTLVIRPQGQISDYLAHVAEIGEVYDCSLPQGNFTLIGHEVSASQPLGFVASGSGITPMPGLIVEALQTGTDERPVTLLYYHHQHAFVEFWQHLSERYANFHYHLVNTQDADSYVAASRYIALPVLTATQLDTPECRIFACGSTSLLAGLTAALGELEHNQATATDELSVANTELSTSTIANLAVENFDQVLAPSAPTAGADSLADNAAIAASSAPPLNIHLRRRGRTLPVLATSQSILQCAEAERIQLPHGCRQGICNTCRCDKISGVVKDIVTGKITHGGQESIKPCISIALTDVVLDA